MFCYQETGAKIQIHGVKAGEKVSLIVNGPKQYSLRIRFFYKTL